MQFTVRLVHALGWSEAPDKSRHGALPIRILFPEGYGDFGREVPMPVDQIGKNGVGSEFIVGENKELEDE